ncbi:opsin-5 [Austrofundulus limnaeus]|uniref:Opsin-5 n=1 Tax=Austrofundulus limnaeus TaxID=52670 RepID=A0A2I4C032_AUSLI|nr:PREDICTED: opsin-5 [Austrofundulus limnaeus]XP_013873353.1 PREDICTED: opsin-5 [Austrofundulus limnaeus]
MLVMENTTYPSNIPHYLLRGDPFASRLSREADFVAAFYICIIGVLSAIGNGYVIFMTVKRKTKLKPPELMTVNLAIFDFGISVTGKPFFVVSSFSHRWLFGWKGCHFYGWTGFFFGCGSLITMTVVSLDRYLKICHLRYGTWLKRHHTFICLAFTWVYAIFWATMPLVGWGNYAPEPFGTSCTLDWWLAQASVSGQTFVMAMLFFCLLLPAGIIVFSYVMIIYKVKSSSKEVSHYDARIRNNHNLEIKLTKVAMLICTGFLIAWIPYAVVSVVSAFGEPDSVPIPVSVIPTLLAKSSAMYNPIIYQLVGMKCTRLSTCCIAMKKRKHFRETRFHTISGPVKETEPDTKAQIKI